LFALILQVARCEIYAECNFGIVAMCESWGYVASETIDAHNEFDFMLDLIRKSWDEEWSIFAQ
jgi:hypothetical protein